MKSYYAERIPVSPLPFQGQKRMFASEFKKILKLYPDDTAYVDLFGGSGLLSHITKREKPDAKVIYNDFDNYRRRLANIPRTNALLAELRRLTVGCERHRRIPRDIRESILDRLELEEPKVSWTILPFLPRCCFS